MNPLQVTVIDYGIGNLFSVGRALEHCGAEVTFTSDPVLIESAPRLVLPGVGAFADGMKGLRERGLVEPIRRHAASGRPLLGICLGMQMLATVSEEFGTHEGLDIVPGRVAAVPNHDTAGHAQKIPHVGWSALHIPPGGNWAASPLANAAELTAVYLVHSFAMVPDDDRDRLADCFYGGHRICAAVRRARVYGCQFHPEKSGPSGLAMVRRFVDC